MSLNNEKEIEHSFRPGLDRQNCIWGNCWCGSRSINVHFEINDFVLVCYLRHIRETEQNREYICFLQNVREQYLWLLVKKYIFTLFALYIQQGHSQYQTSEAFSKNKLTLFVLFSKKHTKLNIMLSQTRISVDTKQRPLGITGIASTPGINYY
jgi:hypothetical protein